jgi:nucleotide-binding universal stress UspA family protein
MPLTGAVPRTCIVALDGSEYSERIVGAASTVAGQANAALVGVIARPGGVSGPDSYLEEAATRAGVTFARTHVYRDRLAATALVTAARDEGDAVVCMTTHARRGLAQALFGSVAEEVIRRTEVPLLLGGPAFDVQYADRVARYDELLVCLDGSPAASEVLPRAARFAAAVGLRVVVVAVVPDGDPEPAWTAAACAVFTDAGVDATAQVLRGEAAKEIVTFAAQRPTAVLGLTTHGRTGMARVSVGSVTMEVVRHASCPVFVVRSLDLG